MGIYAAVNMCLCNKNIGRFVKIEIIKKVKGYNYHITLQLLSLGWLESGTASFHKKFENLLGNFIV